MASGVRKQVGQHLFELGIVGIEKWRVWWNVDPHDDVTKNWGQLLDPVRDDVVDVDGLTVRLEHPGVDSAHAEQVGHEAIEAVHLVAHCGEQLDASFRVVGNVVAKVRGDRANRCQGRAKVVGDRAKQGGALHVESLEFFGTSGLPGEVRPFMMELFDPLVERADSLRDF